MQPQADTARRLQDAIDDYLYEAPHEALEWNLDHFIRDGRAAGEEAFLTMDADDRDHFIEALGDECAVGNGPEAACVVMAAAYDELARVEARQASVKEAA